VHECDLELGKFVEHFHVLSRRCLHRRKVLAVPERDLQEMDGRKIALGHVFQTNEDSHDEIFRTLSVVKQKHNAGNTLFKPFLTIRSDDDKIFLKNDFSPNS